MTSNDSTVTTPLEESSTIVNEQEIINLDNEIANVENELPRGLKGKRSAATQLRKLTPTRNF